MMRDPVFRLRATSYWVMWLLWQPFHLSAWGYHAASILLHIANTFLLYCLLAACLRTRAAALWAAAFFAVQEGHQEAVMWFSAINELLLFLFGAAALLCWVMARGRVGRIAGSAGLFALALLSKESALILLPLFWITRREKTGLLDLTPHALLALAAVVSIAASQTASFRFSDGSFSLAAPFWITWPRSMARLLWPWGWAAAAIVFWRGARKFPAAYASLAWMGIALLPYSFLTYSTQIPSRQTYLASAGLAALVGLALESINRRRLLAAAVVVALVVNLGFLWTRKRRQFLERAEPTEQLIRMARQTPGPIWIRCFPRNRYIAETAVQVGAGRAASDLVWDEAVARRRRATAVFCF
jgi:nitrogen fixation-related uncharacterized protein